MTTDTLFAKFDIRYSYACMQICFRFQVDDGATPQSGAENGPDTFPGLGGFFFYNLVAPLNMGASSFPCVSVSSGHRHVMCAMCATLIKGPLLQFEQANYCSTACGKSAAHTVSCLFGLLSGESIGIAGCDMRIGTGGAVLLLDRPF